MRWLGWDGVIENGKRDRELTGAQSQSVSHSAPNEPLASIDDWKIMEKKIIKKNKA